MKKIVAFPALILSLHAAAQDCAVLVDSLKGKYEGGCKNNVAHGKGIAVGIDSFSGNFKNGYPDGDGKYFSKNGSWYEGHWRKGKFDGQGVYHKSGSQPADSGNISGYWNNGLYVGKYNKPYIIHAATNNVEEVQVKKIKKTGEATLTITLRNPTAGASTPGLLSNEMVMPKSKLTNVVVQKGRIQLQNTDEITSTSFNRYILRNIEFPLLAIFYFDNEQVQLELLEDTSYDMNVKVIKWANPQLYNNPNPQ